MKRRMVLGSAAVCLVAVYALCSAMSIDGSFSACVDVLPVLSPRVDLGINWSGEAWSLTSGTTAVLAPGLRISEELEFRYGLERISVSSGVGMTLIPWAFGSAHLSVSADLLDLVLSEDNPEVIAHATISGGTAFDGGLASFADLTGRVGMAFPTIDVTSTTILSLLPLGVASSVLAQVSLGTIQWGEEGDELKNTLSVQLSLIPFSLTYIQLSSSGQLGVLSIQNTVTYFGGASLLARSTITVLLWDVVSLRLWGSYHSTATDRLGAGLCASVSFGDL